MQVKVVIEATIALSDLSIEATIALSDEERQQLCALCALCATVCARAQRDGGFDRYGTYYSADTLQQFANELAATLNVTKDVL